MGIVISMISNIMRKSSIFIIIIVNLLFGLANSSQLANTNHKIQSGLYFPSSNWKVFDEQAQDGQVKDIRNVDYQSSIEKNGVEWGTHFDADSHHMSDEDDNYKLDINRFFISYKNKNTGVQTRIGRQANSTAGVVGEMDGITLRTSLGSRFSLGASAGFPVNTADKDTIQDSKPFFVLNSTLPRLYHSIVLKPYVVVQQEDGYLNRQSIGMEFNAKKSGVSLYQVMDYNTQFNAVNLWLLQGQLRKSNNALYYMTLNYHRNPALALNNALINDTRASNLKELNAVLSNKEMLEQAENQSARNYSASFGSNFPLSSRFQVGADIKRLDQIYYVDSDEIQNALEHNYQNELSAQLVASNLTGLRDTLKLEYEYVNAKYFINSTVSISNQIELTGLYHLDVEFRMDEGERDNGELVLTTLPRVLLSCQCAKNLVGGLEVGYESWDYSGNTQQKDESWLYSNLNFRLQL